MTNYIYGIVTDSGEHIDVSRTLHGAKCYATRNGYTKVSIRDVNHYYVDVVAEKTNGKWS